MRFSCFHLPYLTFFSSFAFPYHLTSTMGSTTCPYSRELDFALSAVQQAAHVAKHVQASIEASKKDNSFSKSDDSPVTIADFAIQALLIHALRTEFPNDAFVAEEAADELRGEAGERLRGKVWELVQTGAKMRKEKAFGELASPGSEAEMLEAIDLGGKGQGGGKGRVWMLDPIDGTATFLKGQQYCVALALVVDGEEQVGVLGCPNLDLSKGYIHEDIVDKTGHGIMLSAVKGQGAWQRPIGAGSEILEATKIVKRTEVPQDQGHTLQFTDTTLGTSMRYFLHKQIAESLGTTWPGTEIWCSQMRWVALAVGGCDVMLRVPSTKDKRMYVWDHAGGHLIFSEAGGEMVDLDGKRIDFAAGRKLANTYGMIAAPRGWHANIGELVGEL